MKYAELTRQIIGFAYEVHNVMGHFFCGQD